MRVDKQSIEPWKILFLCLILSLSWVQFSQPTISAQVEASMPDSGLCQYLQQNSEVPNIKQIEEIALDDSPVIITSNDDFVTQGWPGNGSVTSPYRLSNLEATLDSTFITIRHTDVHFVIENCTIESSLGMTVGARGIDFLDVSNGTIADCSISGMTTGVQISDCEDCEIANTTILDCIWGVTIGDSSDCVVDNCRIERCYNPVDIRESQAISISSTQINADWEGTGGVYAIYISDSSYCSTINCSIEDAGYGITLEFARYTTIGNSRIEFRLGGIQLTRSDFSSLILCRFSVHQDHFDDRAIQIRNSMEVTVRDCVLNTTRLSITGSTPSLWQLTLENTTSYSKPIGYYYGALNQEINITSHAQLIIVGSVNCDLVGDQSTNLTGGLDFTDCQGCSVDGISTGGIRMHNCTDCSVSNLIVSPSAYSGGIEIDHSSNVDITYVQISGFNFLIIGSSSNSISISNCHLQSTHASANFYDCDHVTMSNLTTAASGSGFHFFACSYVAMIDSNISSPQGPSLMIIESDSFSITNTALQGYGIQLSSSNETRWKHAFDNVTVNGKPLAYLLDISHVSLDVKDYGQIILANASYAQITGVYSSQSPLYFLMGFSDHCSVENVDFSVAFIQAVSCPSLRLANLSTDDGFVLILADQCSNSEIVDCSINGSIQSYSSANVTISRNNLKSDYGAISLVYCSYSDVSDNTIAASIQSMDYCPGIEVIYSDYVAISQNDILGCYVGIETVHSRQVLVVDNCILESGWSGIRAFMSDDCDYKRNFIVDAGTYGLVISDCSHCTFSFNYIANNTDTGINLNNGEGHLIYGNFFSNNGVDATDNGEHNQWYLGQGVGNLWADHSGSSSVSIPGDSGSIDEFPLSCDGDTAVLPVITSPNDVNMEDIEEDDALTWVFWTSEPVLVIFYENGIQMGELPTSSSGRIVKDIGDLAQDSYNFTIVISDGQSILTSDTVLIHAPPDIPIVVYRVIVGVTGSIVVILIIVEVRHSKTGTVE